MVFAEMLRVWNICLTFGGMKRLMIYLLVAMCAVSSRAAGASVFVGESINYDIVYHWGLIWKHAASATMTFGEHGTNYRAMLTARTVSWAHSLFPLHDTLTCVMKPDLRPIKYVKATHENKYEATDVVRFSYNGSTVKGECSQEHDGNVERKTLTSTGPTFDMLSVFYNLRSLKLGSMKKGDTEKMTIFSGTEKETLKRRYVGVERVELRDGSTRIGHHIQFTFTSDNGKESSTPINAWLSTDVAHIPLLLVGKVRIGEVRCYFHP